MNLKKISKKKLIYSSQMNEINVFKNNKTNFQGREGPPLKISKNLPLNMLGLPQSSFLLHHF